MPSAAFSTAIRMIFPLTFKSQSAIFSPNDDAPTRCSDVFPACGARFSTYRKPCQPPSAPDTPRNTFIQFSSPCVCGVISSAV